MLTATVLLLSDHNSTLKRNVHPASLQPRKRRAKRRRKHTTHLRYELPSILKVAWSALSSLWILSQVQKYSLRATSASLTMIWLSVPLCEAAGGDESTGPKCPIFEGVNAAFMAWLIAFSAWIAWKKPDLAPFIRGSSKRPVPVNAAAPTPKERTTLRKWDERNIQLYGAVVSHVASHIQASLHVATPDDGVKAIEHLKQRYGAQSTGDRAEAMARVQKSYIDPRAKIAEADITKQYNEMSMAVADIVSAGGAAIDDTLLISMFENSLPVAYSSIRQMVRYQQHTVFDTYFNDILVQVKAEERSAQSTVATAFMSQSYGSGKGRGGKGKGKGRFNNQGGKGRGKGYTSNWGQSYQSYDPCFNCGGTDHARYNCPHQLVTCDYCGSNHVSEMCSLGPGGPLRDSLSVNARTAIDRAAGKGRTSKPALLTMTTGESHDDTQSHASNSTMHNSRVYNANRKRPITSITSEIAPHDSASNVGSAIAESSISAAPRQPGQGGARVYQADHRPVPTAQEISEYLRSSGFGAFMLHTATNRPPAVIKSAGPEAVHLMAYIDSQASYFAVPDTSYLSKVTEWSPRIPVETANGIVMPDAIGELVISLCDDDGCWHTFTIPEAWVLKSCKKLLYSQGAMNRLGIIHRLDEGYLVLPGGARKSISKELYSVDLMLGYPEGDCALSCQSSNNSERALRVAHSSIPQKLLWHRLGCPGRRIWLGVGDVLSDHGLPPNPHLKYDFETTDAVAQARSRVLPFNRIRDPDPLHVPGSTIYMDFAGPMVASYPHQFVYYCGAIDAGSGFARLMPCHTATKEVAKACLELLIADIRVLMGLTHRFMPHVVVSDQGSQFMSAFFRDFLTDEQVAHRPAVVYTPQQNSFIERMWGTRFATARTLLKAANLGPSFHPFAVQTSNWICNRMPQPWRANLSAFYILSRRLASAAYLRVFGSLCRMTIPWARREGDKHFADRGLLGIYLGPSESSPGCVIYVPSTRRFYTSRNVICYEDTQPGVRHVDSNWSAINDPDQPLRGSPVNEHSADTPRPTIDSEVSSQVPQQPLSVPSENLPTESPAFDLPPNDIPVSDDDFDAIDSRDATRNIEASSATQPTEESVHDPMSQRNVRRKLPSTDSGDPSDPASRLFARQLPRRESRYKGAYYVNPTDATVSEHVQNAIRQALYVHGVPILGDVMLYESTVSSLDSALAITSTTEMGDIVIPRSYRQALEVSEASYWRDAITKELNGLLEIGTFEFVRASDVPTEANIMRCHFVFTVKRNSDGSIEKFKARLVADGNTQRWGIDFDKVFSTVAKLSTLRLILTIAAAFDYNLSSVDIRQAYLQAVLTDDLYMMIPPGLPQTDESGFQLVTRLKRSLYGLKQAGREWHLLLSTTLKEWGFVQSCIDTCLFTYKRGGSILWIVVWVDDCIIADNDSSLRDEFVRFLGTRHPTEDKGELVWVLQVKVVRDRSNRSLTLSQELYINDLVKRHGQLLTGLSRRFDSPFDANLALSHDQCPVAGSTEYTEMQSYREVYMSLVGAYLWLSNVSRPDLCFISASLARFVSNPGYPHYRAALRVLVYLQGSAGKGLVLRPNEHLPLRGFVDADWATKYSISGGLIDYMGAPIHWFSRSQRSVSMSSTESEFFATSLMVKEIMFFRELLRDLELTVSGPTIIRTDNRGVIDLSSDPVSFKKTKHILRAAEFVRDLCARQVVSLQWISGVCNPADIFTKSFSCAVFRKLCGLLLNLPSIP